MNKIKYAARHGLPSGVLLAVAVLLCLAPEAFAKLVEIKVTVAAPAIGTTLHPVNQPGRSVKMRFDISKLSSKHVPPRLPAGAAGERLSGRVGLQVRVSKSGSVADVTVVRSSGSKLLDEAARAWVQYIWVYPRGSKESTHPETIVFQATTKDAQVEAQHAAADHGTGAFRTPRPSYPMLAILEGWQGGVGLVVNTDSSGRVRNVKVVKSSGFPLLDLSAQAFVKSYWILSGDTSAKASIDFRLIRNT